MIAQLSHDINSYHFDSQATRRDFGWDYQGVGASSLSSNHWTPDGEAQYKLVEELIFYPKLT